MQRDALAAILPYGGMPVGNAGSHETILRTIGWTPLVRLNNVAKGVAPKVMAKVEAGNPGGSVKDRVALAMIAQAEAEGWL